MLINYLSFYYYFRDVESSADCVKKCITLRFPWGIVINIYWELNTMTSFFELDSFNFVRIASVFNEEIIRLSWSNRDLFRITYKIEQYLEEVNFHFLAQFHSSMFGQETATINNSIYRDVYMKKKGPKLENIYGIRTIS